MYSAPRQIDDFLSNSRVALSSIDLRLSVSRTFSMACDTAVIASGLGLTSEEGACRR